MRQSAGRNANGAATRQHALPLLAPATYPGSPPDVTSVETHLSWLFFAGEHVFKLKKAVRTRDVNLSTPARREAHLRTELRLNARLAPGVYLGLWGLVDTPAGWRLLPAADCAGRRVVDWLLAMRRLPAADCLLERIRHHELETADVDRLGHWLAAFYRGQPPWRVGAGAYQRSFEAEALINRQVLVDGPLDAPHNAAQALARFDAALHHEADALAQRTGLLVEGHGDLRPEHVFLTDPPVAIDCLEFKADLRRVDPFDEIGFLGMECDIAGAGWVGLRLHDALTAAGLQPPGAGLMRLYTAARALVRARLAMGHLLDATPTEPERWRAAADRYVQRALDLLSPHQPHGWP